MLLYEKISQKGQIVESNRANLPDGVLLRVTYPICRMGLRNANGRVYERAVWDNVMQNDEIKEKMSNRCLYGAPEHPEITQPNLKDTSHIIIETKINDADNTVYQTMDVLDTEYGRIIETLLRAKCQVGVSTRAEGELEEAKDAQGTYMRVVPKTYKYVTTDFTADPSTKNPYPVAVERKVVQEIKEGLTSGKLSKRYATVLLESMQSDEAKTMLNTIKDTDMKIGSKVQIKEGAFKGTMGEVIKVNEATVDISTGEVNINIDKGKIVIVDKSAEAPDMPAPLPVDSAPIEPTKIEAPEGDITDKPLSPEDSGEPMGDVEAEAGVTEEEPEPSETPDIEALKDELDAEPEDEKGEEKEKKKDKTDKEKNESKVRENVDKIMAYEDGELSDEETLELFSGLVKSGQAWKLQGSYGRTAKRLIDGGYLDKSGKILKGLDESIKKAIKVNEGKIVDFIKKLFKKGEKFDYTALKAEIAKASVDALKLAMTQVKSQKFDFEGADVNKLISMLKTGIDAKAKVKESTTPSLRQIQIKCSGAIAEKEKAIEILERTEANLNNIVKSKDLEIKMLSKKLSEAKVTDPIEVQSLRNIIERKTKANKELSESISKASKEKDAEIKALKEQITTINASTKKLQESNQKTLVKKYIDAKVKLSGLKLHSGAKALLESQTSFEEVDGVFDNMTTILRENALHSNRIDEIKLEAKPKADDTVKESFVNAFKGMLGK